MRAEVRREFKVNKMERDPLIIVRMLVTGKECIMEVQRKFNEANCKSMERIQ
jgi:hypothetical protein